ncbi:hypothetical protein CLG96_17785 [Sphingomonas oleivorans]|uniref:Short-chain dehydrogenase n=1 Tax=Sphingomonas oleivorans TaxID=1735121 RepID=A0A2T5FTK5_9SPHN|nr:SDR family oxidoreductase [Sphingomonas oleivorans]PTQ07395.1 hypothetical protein CLG96_17785 [Sphingomonas oleivorans]
MAVKLKPIAQQTIVITGGSSGIGLAAARHAAEAGAAVLLAARNEDALQKAVDDIGAKGGRAAFVAVDIAEEGAAEKIANAAEQRFGGFDTWVNNAAAAVYARLTDTTMEEHKRLFDVGYFGTVQASLVAADQLRQRGGALINIGSVLSERAIPLQGAYSAMKHALRGFTDTLRMELEMDEAPISVTLIKPTSMDTPYSEHARNKMDQPARVPPIVYDPRLVAKAICFAAEHPRREMTVGGQGYLITKLGNIAPRTADRILERFFGEPAQTIATEPGRGTADNLFEERQDGRIDSNRPTYVRHRSLALEAQMHPLATAAIVGGAAAGALFGARRMRERREPHMPTAYDMAAE